MLDAMGTRNARRNLLTVIVLIGISLLLQTIAITTPGWSLFTRNDETTFHGGIFYKVDCKDSCETIDIGKAYTDEIDNARSVIDKLYAEFNLRNEYVRSVVGVLLPWVSTLMSVIVLLCLMKKQKSITHAWVVLIAMASVSGFIMGERIYVYLLTLDWNIRYSRSSESDGFRVHFPYSLFLYALACILEFGVSVLMFKCHYDDVQVKNKYIQDQQKGSLDMNKM